MPVFTLSVNIYFQVLASCFTDGKHSDMDPKAMLLRRMEKKSMRQVAEDLGVSPATISLVLSGERRAGPKLLKALGLQREIHVEITYSKTRK